MAVKNVTGWRKVLFNQRLKVSIFGHYLPLLLNRKVTLSRFVLILRRLLLFLARMQHNKFVSIDGRTRLGLYVPGFPEKAFFTASDKFTDFSGKMPCATALISITSACPYHCEYCYQRHDKGKDLDLKILRSTVEKLQDMGIAFFNIEGGEPFYAYDRLIEICSVIDERSEIWLNSTGAGMTAERLTELKKLRVTAVMFSLHSPEPAAFNDFLGRDDAWEVMTQGVKLCHAAGIAVAFNTCLMRDDFFNGNFEKVMDKAKGFGGCLVQIIKPKPAGGWLAQSEIHFSEEDTTKIKSMVNGYNLQRKYKNYPAIAAQIIEEDKAVFGCTAGGTDRFYLNAKGDLQPCEFLNISFGNIATESFEEVYAKMRGCFEWGGDCFLCEKYAGKINEIYNQQGLRVLPLTPKLSEEIYSTWDRGCKTQLYERLEELR